MYYLEHQRSRWICVFLRRRTENSNSNISKDPLTPTTLFVSRKCMEWTSISKLFKCWLRDFFGTFIPGNENAGGSAICIHRGLLLEEAVVTHLVTCQGRDHLVNIPSGRHNLVIVNVHFELELTLRQLRGRLGLTHPHWPAYPSGWALFWVISTFVTQKKDDLMSGSRRSPMVTRERLQCFIPSFHMSLRLLNLITREGTPQPLGSYALD